MIKFTATRAEFELITKILKRANLGLVQHRETMMDLEACHSNGCPLDFQILLGFPSMDFWHDINGIAEHIDRETGKVSKNFSPRCAAANHTKAAA